MHHYFDKQNKSVWFTTRRTCTVQIFTHGTKNLHVMTFTCKLSAGLTGDLKITLHHLQSISLQQFHVNVPIIESS